MAAGNRHDRFWARGKNKANGNRREPFRLRGPEFVRRWAMHILPKGYTRSRSYGGYHGAKRGDYLDFPTSASNPIDEYG
jgi:hypothetical protein